MNNDNNVVTLFPANSGSPLRGEISKVAQRIDETVNELSGNLSPDDLQRLAHHFSDLRNVAIFLRALSVA